MGGKEGDYIKYTQEIVERLCKGDTKILEKCGNKVQWVLPLHNGFASRNTQLKEALFHLSEGVRDITHQDYNVFLLENKNAVISGTFQTHTKMSFENECHKHCYHVHVVIISGKISCMEIEPKNFIGKQLELHNLDRESRFIWEDEIIYIEALRNHLYWHCQLDVVETTGTLLEIEKKLSDFFVRSHRSYIINKTHVSKVKKFEVSMDNGDILQIPPKRYSEIKRKLQCYSPCY